MLKLPAGLLAIAISILWIINLCVSGFSWLITIMVIVAWVLAYILPWDF